MPKRQEQHSWAVNKTVGDSMHALTHNIILTELLSTKDGKGLVNSAEWSKTLRFRFVLYACKWRATAKRRLNLMPTRLRLGTRAQDPYLLPSLIPCHTGGSIEGPRCWPSTRTRHARRVTRARGTSKNGVKSPYDDSTTVAHHPKTWNIKD